MRLQTLAGAAVAVLLTAALGVPLAHAGADDAIKGRQACMKAHGATMGVLKPMAEDPAKFDAKAVKDAFDAEDKACADWAKWWGADTQKGETVETYAKPEIWTDAKGFEDAGGAWYKAAEAVKAAADGAALKAAFPALGEACGGCHQKFRRPKS